MIQSNKDMTPIYSAEDMGVNVLPAEPITFITEPILVHVVDGIPLEGNPDPGTTFYDTNRVPLDIQYALKHIPSHAFKLQDGCKIPLQLRDTLTHWIAPQQFSCKSTVRINAPAILNKIYTSFKRCDIIKLYTSINLQATVTHYVPPQRFVLASSVLPTLHCDAALIFEQVPEMFVDQLKPITVGTLGYNKVPIPYTGGVPMEQLTIYQNDEKHLHMPLLNDDGTEHIVTTEKYDIGIVDLRTKSVVFEKELEWLESEKCLHVLLPAAVTSKLLGLYSVFIRVHCDTYSHILTTGKLKVAYAPKFNH